MTAVGNVSQSRLETNKRYSSQTQLLHHVGDFGVLMTTILTATGARYNEAPIFGTTLMIIESFSQPTCTRSKTYASAYISDWMK
jgi:hypothetical protein